MQLEEDDYAQFARLHWQLLFFVNQKAGVFDDFQDFSDFEQMFNADLSREDKFDLFGVFYEKPGKYIDAYLAKNPDLLPQEELEIVESWKSLRRGEFVIFRQLQKHAIVLGVGDDEAAYTVLGLSEPLETVLNGFLPAQVETALFPFKGMIVYDGFMLVGAYGFTGRGKRMLNDQYKAAKSKTGPGLITQLSPLGVPKHKPTAAHRVARLVEKLRATLDSLRRQQMLLQDFKDNVEPAFQQWLVKTHGSRQQKLDALEKETDRLAELLERATLSWRMREFSTKAKTLAAINEELKSEEEFFHSAGDSAGGGEDDDRLDDTGDAPFSGSPLDGMPDFWVDSMLEDLLRETRGIDPSRLSAKELEKARQDLLASFSHVSNGDQRALEKSLLKIGADESDKNRTAVTKAFRRLARQVHPDHNPDFGDEAKEIWEQLQQHRDAFDLPALESLEMRWRLIRGDHFKARDEKPLKQLRERLLEEELDIDEEIYQQSNHPMWGKKPSQIPPRTVQKRVKRDIESAIADLEEEKASFERKLAAFRANHAAQTKKKRSSVRKKTAKRKQKKANPSQKKPQKSPTPQTEPPADSQSTFDLG